jgi:acyl-ACP thioesterase
VIHPPPANNRRAFADRKLGVLHFDEQVSFSMEQPVRSYDLDFNLHLNSVRYIAGAIETIPYDFRTNHELSAVDAAFVHEAFLGDPIRSECAQQDDRFVHRFVNMEDETELFQMVSEWSPAKTFDP